MTSKIMVLFLDEELYRKIERMAKDDERTPRQYVQKKLKDLIRHLE